MKLNHVLNTLIPNSPDKYLMVDGHPVDTKRGKYRTWRVWLNTGQMKCKRCGSEVSEIRLVPCTSHGSIHKPSGTRKYTFKLFNSRNQEMTLDHWIPKSFLKKKGLDWKFPGNLVCMCHNCNGHKADLLPADWEHQYVLLNENK